MTVSILGTPSTQVQSGATYTAETGTNRMVVYATSHENASSGQENTAITFGGNAMTLAISADGTDEPAQTGDASYTEIWFLDEPDIPAGSQTLTITGNVNSTGTLYTISGDSALSVGASNNDVAVEINDLSTSISALDGDLIIAVAGAIFSNRTFTWTNVTERGDYVGGGGDWAYSAAEEAITSDGAVSVDADCSNTSSTASITLCAVAFRETASDSIDSIDDPILDGETSNNATYTGFASGDINSGTVDGITLPSASGTTGTITFDNFDIAGVTNDAGTTVPNFGTVTWEFTNGTETANTTADNDPATGWSNVTVASIDTVTESYLYQLITTQLTSLPAPANGDEWYFPTASNTAISAAGGITTDLTTFSFVFIDRTGANEAYPITWTNGTLGIAVASRRSDQALGQYLSEQGYSGSFNDKMNKWLADGDYTGTFNDKWYSYLGDLGYTGNLSDRIKQWQNDS